MTPKEIRPAHGPIDVDEAKGLFEEYSRWIGIDLSFQNFAEELQNLPGDYAPPAGVLLLARSGDAVAGCIAVRKIEGPVCEMKRLFVRDGFRGLGAGEALARAALEWARDAGYSRMLLDTLPSMGSAHRLYERMGFKETEAYRFNPVPGARYMAIDLT
jgi:GNAT superfamily N-acetyltransferase